MLLVFFSDEIDLLLVEVHEWHVSGDLTGSLSIIAIFVTGESGNDWSGLASILSGNLGTFVDFWSMLDGEFSGSLSIFSDLMANFRGNMLGGKHGVVHGLTKIAEGELEILKIDVLEVLKRQVVSDSTGSRSSNTSIWTGNDANDWRCHTSEVSSNLAILVSNCANMLSGVSCLTQTVVHRLTKIAEGELEILKIQTKVWCDIS